MNSADYFAPGALGLIAMWFACNYVADRLVFKERVSLVFGRIITSMIVAAVVLAITGAAIVEAVGPVGFSSFAATVLGGVYGLFFGLFWGIYRVWKELPQIPKASGSSSWVASLGPSRLVVAAGVAAVAMFFLASGFQTEQYNWFGQQCLRAISTRERVGGTCVRPEWLAIGAFFAVVAFMMFRRWRTDTENRP